MIFKNIETEGYTFIQNLKSIFTSGFNGIFASIKTQDFSFTSSFSTTLASDRAALLAYRDAINNNVPATDAFAQTMTNASAAAQEFARTNEVNILGIQNFTNAQKASAIEMMAQNKSFSNCKTLINEYSTGCKNCGLTQEQFTAAISKSNPALAKYLSGLNGAKGSLGGYIASLISSKVATIALQAATMALNMALTMGLSAALQAVISGLSNLINHSQKASEAADELAATSKEKADAAKEEVSQLNELIAKYKELAESDTQDVSTRSAIKDIQEQIVDLVGQQAGNLDLVNGKLDDELSKLLQIQQIEAEKAVETATSAYHSSRDSSDKAVGGMEGSFSHPSIGGTWDYIGSRDEEAEQILKDAGFAYGVNITTGGWADNTLYLQALGTDAQEKAEYLQSMIDALKSSEVDYDYASSDFYNALVSQRDAYLEYADSVNEAAQSLVDSIITVSTYDSELSNMTVDSVNSFDEYRSKLIELVKNSPDLAEALANGDITENDIGKQVNDYLATLSQFSSYYTEWIDSIENSSDLEERLHISFSDLFGDDSDFISSVDEYIQKVNTLQDALGKYRDGNFSNDDLVDLLKDFPELSDETDNLDEAIINLLGDLNGDMLNEFGNQFGNMETDEDVAALQNFQDAVLELGQVVGDTEFSIDIGTETEGMENLFTAMKESVTSTGLTAESITNLKERYQDLENYNAAALFEKTANGVHLNTKALRELESAYEKQKKNEIDTNLQSLVSDYNDLTEKINDCSNATERAELYKQRNDILDQINDTQLLAAQYEGLTSAFYKWEQAQSIGEEGDMYDSLAGGLENIKELYNDGLVGTNEFRAAVQLMSNEDLSTANVEELMAAYEAGYSKMTRYFQDSSDGCLNFLHDVQDLNSEWAHMNEDGSWDIDFGMGNDQEIADALGINVESVQAIMRKLSDYGFDINLDSMYSSLDMLKSDAEEANDKLKELGKTDYTFSFNTDDIDNLNEQIEVAKETLDQFKNEDGTVNLELEGAEEAQGILATLIYQKQSLDKSAVLSVDTSNANSEIETVISKLQEFKSSYNTLEVQAAVGADTTQAQADVDAALASLSSEHAEILANLGIDTSSADAAIASINALTPEVMVTCGLDASLIEGYQAAEHTTTGEVIWDNNIAKVTAWANQSHKSNGTVTWDNDTSKVKTYFTATGKVNWTNGSGGAAGTAHAYGTAKARGDWGTKESGVALGGELGQELVVRNGKFFTIGDKGAEFFQYKKGDIIFNANQTEEIFKKGKITANSPRGRLFAEGTAFSSGSGTIYAKGSVKTTASGSSGSSKNNGSSSNTSDSDEPEVIDWIEIAIERLERAIKNLETTASSAYKTLKERLSATSSEISKVNEEISLQQKAYNRYMQEAKSVGLSSDLQKKVQNGTIDISEYDDETAELIKEYQEWYEKALDCSDAIQELHENLASLYEDKFNNIATDYENQLAMLEHMTNTYENGIDNLEARGYLGSAKYYEALRSVEEQNISILEQKLNDLTIAMEEAVNSGEIEEGSEAWYEMQQEINATKEEIQEANTSVIELNNSIRDLNWEVFDYLQDRISTLTDEAQFLIDLMSTSDLYDDKGQLTDTGKATMGLHGQNYNTYMAQADKYASEIENINKELANDPYNTELIARKEELLELQRESILAAEDEKQAIVDMVEEGINIELDALKELIDAYTDSLDGAKDLYDYQKKVQKQTDEIATIQKKISAYKGDTSQENQARLQELNVDLSDALEELEETEYEHYISEQKKMLDNLYDEYELILNQRLDNIDVLIGDMITATNESAATIKATLESESEKVGYTMTESMKSVWSNEGGANAIITKYGDNFSSQLTSLNTVISGISTKVDAMVATSNKEASSTVSGSSSGSSSNNSSSSSSSSSSSNNSSSNSSSSSSSSKSSGDGVAKVGDKVTFKSGKYYSSSDGNSPTGTKYQGKQVYITKINTKSWATKPYHISTGSKLGNGDLGWVTLSQLTGYSTGGLVDYDGLAMVHGGKKPELVLNSEDTENFIALKDALRSMAENNVSLTGYGAINSASHANGAVSLLPEIQGATSVAEYLSRIASTPDNAQPVSIGDVTYEINIPIDHVTDYDDLVNQMCQDGKFEKFIQSITLERMMGGSQFSKRKYKW